MKKIILLLAGMMPAILGFSQSNTEEIDYVQSIYGMEKKVIVADFVQPKEANKVAFWEVYDQYEVERKALGKERIKLIEDFAAKWENMTNEQSEEWMKNVRTLAKKQDKLVDTYYNKIKKVTSAITAMRFYQLEGYLLSVIRLEILDAIPFVEDSDE